MISLNDLIVYFFNIQIALFGISVTIFTVLFAFILSKKDELKLIVFQIEKGDNSPSIHQKRSFVISHITTLKLINKKILGMVISSFILLVFSFISIFFIFESHYNMYIQNSIILILVIEFIYFSFSFNTIVRYYRQSTKI